MIKRASLDEELFIVLLPGGQVLKKAVEMQKYLSEYYNIYKENKLPELHITIDRIKKENLKRVKQIVNEEIKKTGPIKIKLSQFECYQLSKNDFLVLKLEKTSSLMKFSSSLHQRLKAEALSTIDDYEKWKFHITIISSLFAENPLSQKDFDEVCLLLEGEQTCYTSPAERLEIWIPTLDQEKKCLYSCYL
ncbi:MAG: 2'-5' RNA ligase family protein [Halothermotrichaceae bacterium]